jgi:hypothetical protein
VQVSEAIFVDTFSVCHARTGAGIKHLFPRLAGADIVKPDDPTSLVPVILTGVKGARNYASPTSPAMP